MADDYVNKIISFLNSQGIHQYHFERRTKSRVVVIPYNGRLNRVMFPLGGPDWRGPANTLANLRHALGLFGTKAPRKRRSLKRPRKLDPDRGRRFACRPFSERAAPAQDRYFEPLMLLKARLEAAANLSANEASAHRGATSRATETVRVALKIPWLGRQQRWTTI